MISKVSGIEAKDEKYRGRYDVSKSIKGNQPKMGIASFSEILKEAKDKVTFSDNQNN